MPAAATHASAARALAPRIAAVRRFSRFYTRRLGLLEDGFLDSPFSLAEARVLYELTQRDAMTATMLADALGLDPGYLSRMLHGFRRRRLVTRTPAPQDRRQSLLTLTPNGRKAFAPLERRSQDGVAAMLGALPAADQERVVGAMGAIERLVGGRSAEQPACVLRPPRAGEMGWVVARHGSLYAQEHGWGVGFEGLVAEIVANYVKTCDPDRARCWIADIDGEPVGSVFIEKGSDEVAKLRLLLVDPKARGHGIGTRLVEECIRFARAAGYRKISLWTRSVLTDARRIYRRAGFRRVGRTKPHAEFGMKFFEETWELKL